jgi:hypothetical protein
MLFYVADAQFRYQIYTGDHFFIMNSFTLHVFAKHPLIILISLFLIACSGNPYNPTVFNYEIDNKIINNPDYQQVVIASVNFGKPSRLHLQKEEARIDKMVKSYLQKHGFTVASSRLFESHWQQAIRKYGEPYNPSTGKLTRYHQAVLADTIKELTAMDNIDAVIFTDLIERDIQFTSGLSHIARWDGVSRKPSLQGPGSGVPADFNWAAQVQAVSLWVSIYDASLQRVFTSVGGIEVTDAIDMKASSPGFVRRRNILDNDSQIMEGIQLAFHPLIIMPAYPKKER